MDLNTLSGRPNGSKKRKRVGRGPGSGTGKTSGRGVKGQKSRSGYSRRYGFEGGQMPLNRRLPKRGFTHLSRHPFGEVNLDSLNEAFEDGAKITAKALIEKGLIKVCKGGVKILGRGELSKKFNFEIEAVSAGARTKIESAGGSIHILEPPPSRAVKPPRNKPAPAGG